MFRCRDEQKRWECLHRVSELTVRQRIIKEKSARWAKAEEENTSDQIRNTALILFFGEYFYFLRKTVLKLDMQLWMPLNLRHVCPRARITGSVNRSDLDEQPDVFFKMTEYKNGFILFSVYIYNTMFCYLLSTDVISSLHETVLQFPSENRIKRK